jgi:hypothetical protein
MDWLALKIAKSDQQSGGGDFWPSVGRSNRGNAQPGQSERLSWEIYTGDNDLAHAGFWSPEEPMPETLPEPQSELPDRQAVLL